eukprot:1151771-Pelagomonas_calceolata.AAC.3
MKHSFHVLSVQGPLFFPKIAPRKGTLWGLKLEHRAVCMHSIACWRTKQCACKCVGALGSLSYKDSTLASVAGDSQFVVMVICGAAVVTMYGDDCVQLLPHHAYVPAAAMWGRVHGHEA